MAKSARARAKARSRKISRRRTKDKKNRTAAARDAVFGTFELTEKVLGYLDFNDLINSKNANRYFLKVIEGTKAKPLQQELFLLPKPVEYHVPFDSETGRVLLCYGYSFDMENGYHFAPPLGSVESCSICTPDTVDNAVFGCEPRQVHPFLEGFFDHSFTVLDVFQCWVNPFLCHLCKDHIYRAMLISKPPTKEARLQLYRDWDDIEPRQEFKVECETGITFGMVADEVEKYEEKKPENEEVLQMWLEFGAVAYDAGVCEEERIAAYIRWQQAQEY